MQNIKLPPGFPHPFLTVLEGFVKNVCISDVVTGLIFFQKVYKWKESSAFNNLGGLIKVFFQVANQMDSGEISSVNFEALKPSPRGVSSLDRNPIKRRTTCRRSSMNQQKKTPNLYNPNQTMQMRTVKTPHIIVTVFYDMQGSDLPTLDEMMKVDLFMHSVRTAFEDAHLQTYIAKRSQIRYELDNMAAGSEDSDLLTVKDFVEFGTLVDQLRDQLFPLARPRKLVPEVDMHFIEAWNIEERVKKELIFAFEQIRLSKSYEDEELSGLI